MCFFSRFDCSVILDQLGKFRSQSQPQECPHDAVFDNGHAGILPQRKLGNSTLDALLDSHKLTVLELEKRKWLTFQILVTFVSSCWNWIIGTLGYDYRCAQICEQVANVRFVILELVIFIYYLTIFYRNWIHECHWNVSFISLFRWILSDNNSKYCLTFVFNVTY